MSQTEQRRPIVPAEVLVPLLFRSFEGGLLAKAGKIQPKEPAL